jgi:hypothetical protein
LDILSDSLISLIIFLKHLRGANGP